MKKKNRTLSKLSFIVIIRVKVNEREKNAVEMYSAHAY